MNRMMIRGSLLATVATVALLACVTGIEANGGTAKPPSGSQDMGTLSAANDYNVLLNPNQSNTFWISVPAELGQYAIELASNGGTYTYFVEENTVTAVSSGWKP